MIKNIIFDMGNVLVAFRWKDHMRDMGFSEEEIQELGDKWVKDPLWDEHDRGVLSDEEVLSLAIGRMPRLEARVRQFWENPDGLVRKLDYAVPWVRECKERGLRVYLLSNYPETFFEAHKKEFEYLPFVDGAVISCREKLIKPDPAIYVLLLDRYGLKAEECIFIDDRQENVDAAASVGLHTVLFENYEQAKSEMEKIISSQRQEA